MFDGITSDLLKAQLRHGSCYTSLDSYDFLKSYLSCHGNKYPDILKVIRGDSGFAVPSQILLQKGCYGKFHKGV